MKTAKEMLDRRTAVLGRNETLASVPGSGHFQNDKGDMDPARKAAKDRGEPSITEHVVQFPGRYEFFYVGPDVERITSTLKAYSDKNRPTLTPQTDPDTQKQVLIVDDLKPATEDGVPILAVRAQQQNDLLRALQANGIGMTVADQVER